MARTKQTARVSTYGPAPRQHLYGYPDPQSRPHTAWNVPEIVEEILLQLPMKDLLLAQSVCHYWQDIIGTSPRLQKALFFMPQSSSPLEDDEDQESQRAFNPLLTEKFSAWLASKPYKPLGQPRQHIEDGLWATEEARLALLRSGASWRRMLISQPPLTIWEEAHTCHAQGGDSLSTGSVNLPDGLRMGLVYDQTEEAFQSGSTQRFYTIFDGVIPAASLETSEQGINPPAQRPPRENENQVRDRVFAGKNTMTLVVKGHRGCTGNPPSRHDQTFVSTDCQKITIEMNRVASRKAGRAFGWFTADGFHRFPKPV